MSILKMEVEALDATFGYKVTVLGSVTDGSRYAITEHYATEAEVATRLGTIWSQWAALVDSE